MAFNDPTNHDIMMVDDLSFIQCTQFVDPILAAPTLQCSSSDSNELMPLPETFDSDNVCNFSNVAWNDQVEELPPFDYYPPLSFNEHTFDQNIDMDCFSFDNNAMFVGSNSLNVNVATDNALVKNVSYDKEKEIEKSKSKIGEIGLEEMRKHFYLPIVKAAKEMNVGVTLLKKRCRELGIPRWPHRKMKSLNNLICNVEELGKVSDNECVKREIEMLKEHKRVMEENPLVELTDRNKMLRQACFKANYKKKRAREMPHSSFLY